MTFIAVVIYSPRLLFKILRYCIHWFVVHWQNFMCLCSLILCCIYHCYFIIYWNQISIWDGKLYLRHVLAMFGTILLGRVDHEHRESTVKRHIAALLYTECIPASSWLARKRCRSVISCHTIQAVKQHLYCWPSPYFLNVVIILSNYFCVWNKWKLQNR